ncbi:MAG: hypothetical protein A7315_01940 [Candidatus Altiarchaeales archaeon WOR_SM1_79]|nr:MAG: hypothetical protein A7315_01940 [Candidatus Altiarchaeales archaeon WOR_SM1_79]
MRLKIFWQIAFILILVLTTIAGDSVLGQVWWEEIDESYHYDLSKFNLLVLLGDDFDYHETVVIKKYWEDWGAKVDIAGVAPELTGHAWKVTSQGWDRSENRQIKTDLLLSQVNLSKYQVLFMPGGNSPKNLLAKDSVSVTRLIKQADKNGLLLAAICHGPHLLAAADVIKDHNVTGHREIVSRLSQAGGRVVNEVCVVDGNIITGNFPYFGTMAMKVAEKLLYPNGGGPSEKSPFVTNAVLKAIKERRSIRRFQDKAVDPNLIKIILKAAIWAPSPNNNQPWKFVVVRDRGVKEKIVETLVNQTKIAFEKRGYPSDAVKRYWSNLFSSPVHIFAFCDTAGVEIDKDWQNIDMLHCMQSVSAACQNILLAATALDLGSLWIGATLIIEPEIKKLLKVPKNFQLVSTIAIGYVADKSLPPVRKSLSRVLFYESWSE